MLSRSIKASLGFLRPDGIQLTAVAGIKYFPPPKNYDHIEIPDRQRLRIVDKVPQYPPNLKPPKMQKRLRYMRGPETLHNTLQLKQYGVVATGGGRMRYEHFEMARLVVARRLDQKRMFAIWRIDPPWQPITKKGQGQRMGGGKGAIDHYVTPIKAGRIILEVGGKCEYEEVKTMLRIVAERLPFQAEPVSQEIMEKKAAEEKWKEENNKNPYSMKYIIQNNMGGCHKMLSPFDHKWYGKYL
ncbi:39S ribosomal protein L16, mitochondrial [Pectinophora gossypiella]|uniref:39S ribosomal protein L16, mitochondrial n=1 Tax=Pectinophora gossypiella TaxID=13191 RepID=UPI00214EC550|nr:39S ribosomal protein L16, mitochondrial [Pectinophora gossypiella]